MSYLNDLYQEVILDHNKNPRNLRELEDADRVADGHNPLCGDKVTVFLKMEDHRIADACFKGTGCAISTASASLMTETIKGKTEWEVNALFDNFHNLVTGKLENVKEAPDLGKLAVFHGVSEFPVRVKCATLAWHTLLAALKNLNKTVSTE